MWCIEISIYLLCMEKCEINGVSLIGFQTHTTYILLSSVFRCVVLLRTARAFYKYLVFTYLRTHYKRSLSEQTRSFFMTKQRNFKVAKGGKGFLFLIGKWFLFSHEPRPVLHMADISNTSCSWLFGMLIYKSKTILSMERLTDCQEKKTLISCFPGEMFSKW